MFKKLATVAVFALFAGTAFAQQTVQDAQNLLRQAGIEIEIPATATQDQIDQIIAIMGDASLQPMDAADQIRQLLGMN